MNVKRAPKFLLGNNFVAVASKPKPSLLQWDVEWMLMMMMMMWNGSTLGNVVENGNGSTLKSNTSNISGSLSGNKSLTPGHPPSWKPALPNPPYKTKTYQQYAPAFGGRIFGSL